MRVLLTMNLPYTRVHGGTNRSNRALAAGLAALGHEVEAIVPALPTPSLLSHEQLLTELRDRGISVETRAGVDHMCLDGVRVRAVVAPEALRAQLLQRITDFRPDAILVSAEDPSQNLLSAVLARAAAPVVYLAHTPQLFPFGPASLYPSVSRTRLLGSAQGILTISQFVADYVKRWSGFESFLCHPPHYDLDASPLGDPKGRVLLMNASAIKGLDIFLELARKLPQVGFSALPGYATTSSELATLKSLPNVELRANREHLDDVLRGIGVLLVPTLWLEGFGMAAVDAMLRGVPVLAANHGGLVEAALGQAGLLPVRPIERFSTEVADNGLPLPLVPAQPIAEWLYALDRLTSDAEHYRQRSSAAREAALAFAGRASVAPLVDWLSESLTRPRLTVTTGASLSFQTPRDAMAQRLRRLEPSQRALLVGRVARSIKLRPKLLAIPVGGDREGPLSYAQQRLWFLQQLDPTSAAYNVPLAVRLRGPLAVDALRRALSAVVRRHAILRTTYHLRGHRLVQVVSDDDIVDFQPETAALAPSAVHEALDLEARRPFDLSRSAPLRVRLLRLTDQDHVLLLVAHHVACDGGSLSLLLHDVKQAYAQAVAGLGAELPPLPLQYLDYARWQRERPLVEDDVDYWRQRLDPEAERLDLANMKRPRRDGDARGQVYEFRLPTGAQRRVAEFSKSEGVTPFVTLLALFQTLLYRHGGRPDLVIGTVASSRERIELEPLIGLFVDTLPIRVELHPALTFRELVHAVQDRARDAQAHARVPFDKLVELLAPARNVGQTPLVQAMFVYGSDTPLEARLGDLSVEPLPVLTGAAKFDLTLFVSQHAEELRAGFEYRSDCFDPSAIEAMAQHYQNLLGDALTSHLSPLPRLAMLEASELAFLDRFAGARDVTGVGAPMIRQFEARVEERPDAVALWQRGQSLSYAELDERANRLAARLASLGAGPEHRVAVCLPRTFDLVAALLAVHKCGAAYVPLDPNYPKERLQLMASDCAALLVVTSSALAGSFTGWGGTQVLVDQVQSSVDLAPFDSRSAPLSPRALSHIIYTSGSTGRPKGVAIEHHSVSVLLDWARAELDPKWCDGVLASTSICFDLSVFELFWPLSSGGRVVLVENVLELPGLGEGASVRLVNTVPSAADALCRVQGLPASVACVCLAGEALPGELVDRIYQLPHVGSVYNLYGPSEDTTYSTYSLVRPGRTPPIGRPLPGTYVRIVDEQLSLVPPGNEGELLLGGAGLARCYFGRPELTAERFIPDPWPREGSEQPGSRRLYRTGDRVRFDPDGNLYYLGRQDEQVKIRGFRIELGEIEAVLKSHADVRDAVVLAQGNGADKRLVAHVVAQPELGESIRRKPRVKLANGLEVVFQRRSELDHFYADIFEEGTYLRHGLTIEPGDVVIDVGSNIGMFALFAGTRAPGVRVLCFEPVPQLCELLAANMALNAVDAKVFGMGVAERDEERSITFFPESSGMSSFYPDLDQEKEVLRHVFRNESARASGELDAIVSQQDELLDARLRGTVVTTRVTRLSSILRSEAIDRVDFLKIDVQKSERDVLDGIDAEDWLKIRQLAVEVHDFDGHLAQITALLEQHGFEVTAEQDPLFVGSIMYNLYARRPARVAAGARAPRKPAPLPLPPVQLRDLAGWLKQRLPAQLCPSSTVFWRELPRTPNGKLDRAALRQVDGAIVSAAPPAVSSELEATLLEIVRALLGNDRARPEDNFFDLGGHSLLLLDLQRQIRDRLGRALELVDFFRYPSVASLAGHLEAPATSSSAGSPSVAPELGVTRRQKLQAQRQRRLRLPNELDDASPSKDETP